MSNRLTLRTRCVAGLAQQRCWTDWLEGVGLVRVVAAQSRVAAAHNPQLGRLDAHSERGEAQIGPDLECARDRLLWG